MPSTQRRRSNGEGSTWWDDRRQRYVGQISVRDETGAMKRRTVVATTQAELAKRLDQLRAHIATDAITATATNLTVAQFLHRWTADVIPLEGLRPNTVTSYRDTVARYINPYVGHVPLATLAPRHVEHMMRSLVDKGYSGSVVSKSRKILARALRVALRDQLVTRNVAALVDGIPVPRSKGKTLTPDEAAALLRAAEADGCYAIVAILVGMGLRRGELLGLRWCEVDLEAGTLTVNGVIARGLEGLPEFSELTKTSSSRRRLHLPDAIAAALAKHKRAQHRQRVAAKGTWARDWPHDDFVFTTNVGTPYDLMYVTRLVTRVAAEAGLGHWSPHDLRHSAASILLAMPGANLKEISEMLGHSSIRVTADIYAHVMEPARRSTAEAMQAAIFR
jgi:integrase